MGDGGLDTGGGDTDAVRLTSFQEYADFLGLPNCRELEDPVSSAGPPEDQVRSDCADIQRKIGVLSCAAPARDRWLLYALTATRRGLAVWL